MTTYGPVVVVGAGPTGLTAALLLARAGVDVLVLERHADVHPLPRAVHLDDEVFRVLQRAGVAGAFAPVTRPARGLRLLDRRHRTLAQFDRGTGEGPNGYPQANMFDQPDLERVLRDALARQPTATLRTGVEVLSVEGRGPVTVLLHDPAAGQREQLAAVAVLGCDGAHSRVRAAVGAGLENLGFTERWLVVDARCPVPLDVWDGVYQVCDGRRAATYLRVGADRHRWEFQLHDGESAEQLAAPDRLAELVRPWLRASPGAALQVLRSTDYTFRARLADRWQRGRVFLLGDAAHLTPPFVGQGLGAGLRDAANLSWKLAAVLQGRAPEALLRTYQLERRPHARAVIRLAVTAGWTMTGGQGRAAAVRRIVLGTVFRLPGASGLVLERGSPPLVRGPLVPRARLRRHALAGRLAPQPRVGPGRVLLDELLGPGFAVLTRVPPDPALHRLAARLDAPVIALAGLAGAEPLQAWLRRGGATAAVLRPDRTVLLTARSSAAPGEELARTGAAVLRLVGA